MSEKREVKKIDIREWVESELRKIEEMEQCLSSLSNSSEDLSQEGLINAHDLLKKHITHLLKRPEIDPDQRRERFSFLKEEISQPIALGSQLTKRIEKARKQQYRKALDIYGEIADSIRTELNKCQRDLRSLERDIDRDMEALKDYKERLKQLIEIEKACGDSDIVIFLSNELTWVQNTLSELSSLKNEVDKQLQEIGEILEVLEQYYYRYY